MPLLPMLVPVPVAVALLLIGHRPGRAWWGLTSAGAVMLPAAVVTVTGTGYRFGPVTLDGRTAPALLVTGAVAAVALAALPGWSATALADRRIGPTTARWYAGCCAVLPGVLAAGIILPGRYGPPAALVLGGAVLAVLAGHRRDTASRAAAARVFAVNAGAAVLLALGPSTGAAAGVLVAAGLAVVAVWPPTVAWPRTTRLTPPAPIAALAVAWPVVALTAIGERLPDTAFAHGTVVVIAVVGLGWAVLVATRGTRLRELLDAVTVAGAAGVLLAASNGWSTAAMLALRLAPAVAWSAAGAVLSLTGSLRPVTVRGMVRRDPAAAVGLVQLGPVVAVAMLGVLLGGTPGPTGIGAGAVVVVGMAAVTVVMVTAVAGHPGQRPHLTTGPPARFGASDLVLVLGTAAATGAGVLALSG